DTFLKSGDEAIVHPGAELEYLASPYATFGSATGRQNAGSAGLTIFAAFAEGQVAAYITTAEWDDFERIWMQPLYVALPQAGAAQPLRVFGVSAASRFYSPYWQIFYYTPSAGVQFKSERDVLDSKVRLTPGPGVFAALTDDATITTAVQQGDDGPLRPLTGTPVGKAANEVGYVEGALTHYVSLGDDQRFTWNYETLVVDETPIYLLAFPGADGNPLPSDLPLVIGTGPLHLPRCDGKGHCGGVSANGVPEWGAAWVRWNVLLPPEADVYVRPGDTALRGLMRRQGAPATVPAFDLPDDFVLRVAANGVQCFQTGPATCHWLDSQNAIEELVPDFRVTETEDRVASPLVLFNGTALGR
ncbi:MAG TPA: hypothetical protein VH083_26860, partial [Myxococcales bacterium]|nr:hypothetical protein [Myxococcales bacterium]